VDRGFAVMKCGSLVSQKPPRYFEFAILKSVTCGLETSVANARNDFSRKFYQQLAPVATSRSADLDSRVKELASKDGV
jgi:hypothetical protein